MTTKPIAIHQSDFGFHTRWVRYCLQHRIPFIRVDCYSNDVIEHLSNCSSLMWHHAHGNPCDLIVAKQILFALEHSGFVVFPNFNTGWHFDDKLGQKYLMEALGLPTPTNYGFYSRESAIAWAKVAEFPKVFKLRGGAGASNVLFVKNRSHAERIIRKAFGAGFPSYDPWGSLKERWRSYRSGKASFNEPLKGLLRFLRPPEFAKIQGRQRGYVLFQDFVPNNSCDTRVIVIGDKAFGLKRFVRPNDFRASGSGQFDYERETFEPQCIELAFHISERIGNQVGAYDFVIDSNRQPLLLEMSYGFSAEAYDQCPGYWDQKLNWHPAPFNPYAWMVDSVLDQTSAGQGSQYRS